MSFTWYDTRYLTLTLTLMSAMVIRRRRGGQKSGQSRRSNATSRDDYLSPESVAWRRRANAADSSVVERK